MRVTIEIDFPTNDPIIAAAEVKQWLIGALYNSPGTPEGPVQPVTVTAHDEDSTQVHALDFTPEDLEEASPRRYRPTYRHRPGCSRTGIEAPGPGHVCDDLGSGAGE